MRLRPREREGWLIGYNQWGHSRSPKMLSISLVIYTLYTITVAGNLKPWPVFTHTHTHTHAHAHVHTHTHTSVVVWE